MASVSPTGTVTVAEPPSVESPPSELAPVSDTAAFAKSEPVPPSARLCRVVAPESANEPPVIESTSSPGITSEVTACTPLLIVIVSVPPGLMVTTSSAVGTPSDQFAALFQLPLITPIHAFAAGAIRDSSGSTAVVRGLMAILDLRCVLILMMKVVSIPCAAVRRSCRGVALNI